MTPTWFGRWVSLFSFLVIVVLAPPAGAIEVQRVVADDIEAWLVEDHTNPIISVNVAFRGGSDLDPPGREGLAMMAAALLDEGAGDLDSQAFQQRLEDLAVRLQFSAGRDRFGGGMQTLTETRDEAFRMLRLALTEPRFDAEPVERVRSQMQASLRMDAEDPDSVASQRFFATVFPGHPYGRPPDGTPESVAAITADEIRALVDRHLARDTLVIGVAGDITPVELRPLLTTTFGILPAQAAPADIADIRPHTDGAAIVVEMNAPQSSVVFGQPGIKRNSPDFYAATVLVHILAAGSFTSRLFEEVREKRGLVYSVYSRLVPLQHSALIVGHAGTTNRRVGETISVIRGEWQRMVDDGIRAEELADAKTYLTGSFALRLSSTAAIAEILSSMQIHELGIDYLDKRNTLVEAVTLADANRLARELLDPGELTFVVAGQPEGPIATD